MLTDLLARLNQPFPERSSPRRDVAVFAGVGVFIFLFLFFFKPFGLHEVPQSLVWVCLGFGLVTFACGVAFEQFCRYLLGIQTDVPSWTLGKWIIQSLALIVVIGVGNFIYVGSLYPTVFNSWESLLSMVANTVLVGIIPVVFAGLYIQLDAARTNQKEADSIKPKSSANSDTKTLELELNKHEMLKLAIDDIVFIEAMQNYVLIHYIDSQFLSKQTIRKTLNQISQQLADSSLLRCHRSYILNTNRILAVTGNAQGLRVTLATSQGLEPTTVPVSRTYLKTFKASMQ